ncbi:hypothetical protein DIPPA_03457 [Diplonema papillatum]|nr:hypothetical protein DIPPA_03457 [Diplonema papillatum]
MNEVAGDGIDVVKELPRILRDFATECRRERVVMGPLFDDFATRYFAERAGCAVEGESEANRLGLTETPAAPSIVTKEHVARDYTDAENRAAIQIQAHQRGRQTRAMRKRAAPNTWAGFESKLKHMPEPLKMEFGAGLVLAIFHKMEVQQGGEGEIETMYIDKVVFAVKEPATGRCYASQLTPETLPPVLPMLMSFATFWASLKAAPASSFTFDAAAFPAALLAIDLASGKGCRDTVKIPCVDMGDSNVDKDLFVTPFLAQRS